MILSIEGDEATGKTALAYTAPLPIVGFSFDPGYERAILGARYEEFFEGLNIKYVDYDKGGDPKLDTVADITIYNLPQQIQIDSDAIHGTNELWSYFVSLYTQAVQGGARSLVVDTMTLARRIKADAYLQTLQEKNAQGARGRKQLLQIEWGHANDSIRDLYSVAQALKKNLVAIHHMTDERKDGIDRDGAVTSMLTGKKVLEGLNQTYRYVDVALRMEKKGSELTGTMVKCGYNLQLEGNPLKNVSWDRLVTMIEMGLGGRI